MEFETQSNLIILNNFRFDSSKSKEIADGKGYNNGNFTTVMAENMIKSKKSKKAKIRHTNDEDQEGLGSQQE